MTNGYSKAKRTQDREQSVKGQETWIVKADDCGTARQETQDTSILSRELLVKV